MGKKNRDWYEAFLEVYRRFPQVGLACKKAGVPRSTAYRAMEEDKVFKRLVAEAKAEAIEYLEFRVWQRAIAEEPSERLMVFLLQAHAPELYSKRRLEVSGPGGSPIEIATQREVMVRLSSDPESAAMLQELSVKAAMLEVEIESASALGDSGDDGDGSDGDEDDDDAS